MSPFSILFTLFALTIVDVISRPAEAESDQDNLIERIEKELGVGGGHFEIESATKMPVTKDEELDAWEAPEWILKEYPYFLSGYDDENRPIWIANWGRFDVRKVVKRGKESKELFAKYIEKTVRLVHKSAAVKNTTEHPVTQSNFIVDFDGLVLEQLSDLNTISYLLSLARNNADLILGGSNRIVLINVNYVAELVIRLAKTALGSVFQKVDVFGPNKAQWIPQLRRFFPPEALPERYGGEKGHKPLFTYG